MTAKGNRVFKLGLMVYLVVALALYWVGLVPLSLFTYSIPPLGLSLIVVEEWVRTRP